MLKLTLLHGEKNIYSLFDFCIEKQKLYIYIKKKYILAIYSSLKTILNKSFGYYNIHNTLRSFLYMGS
jgi:hypothetical protein